MQQQTSEQIRARLAEITKAQAAHAARDFDAEMLAIMQDGGNVDALEESQLEAERQARRLRVEKQALDGALPLALAREAQTELDGMSAGMADQLERFREAAKKAYNARVEAHKAKTIMLEIHSVRSAAFFRAKALGSQHGIAKATDPFRKLVSSRLDSLEFKSADCSTNWEYESSNKLDIDSTQP